LSKNLGKVLLIFTLSVSENFKFPISLILLKFNLFRKDFVSRFCGKAILILLNTNLEKFLNFVDASAVFANTSTRFNDGFEFGLGAEVAVSTSKLHARGPMGLESITSYKWKVVGNGQIRI